MKCSIAVAAWICFVCGFAAPLHGTGMSYPHGTGAPTLGGAGHAAPSGHSGPGGPPGDQRMTYEDLQKRKFGGFGGHHPSGGFHAVLPRGTGSPYPIGTGTPTSGSSGSTEPVAPGHHNDRFDGLRSHRQKRQLSSLLGGLGGSGTGPLGSLSTGYPYNLGLGSSSSSLGGLKAKRQLGSLTGSGTSSGLGSLTSGTASLTGLLNSLESELGSSSSSLGGLKAKRQLGSLTGTGTSSGLGSLSSGTATLTGLLNSLESELGSSSSSSSLGSLKKRQFGDLGSLTTTSDAAVSSNDVLDNTGCKSVTLIFARGTDETGTLGTIVGPSLASDLQTATGSLAVQGLSYAADIAGDEDLGAEGGPVMVKVAQQALSQCPDTKLVLGGYSQGAMVVHYALANGLSGATVAAVTAFGDPENGDAFTGVSAADTVRYCDEGDVVCDLTGTTTGTGTHLSYGSNTQAAAEKIAQIVGVTA